MSKLPTLFAVFRFWKDVPGSEVYISAHENESLAGHVQGLVRSNDATTRVVEYLPAAKCVPKERVRELVELWKQAEAEALTLPASPAKAVAATLLSARLDLEQLLK